MSPGPPEPHRAKHHNHKVQRHREAPNGDQQWDRGSREDLANFSRRVPHGLGILHRQAPENDLDHQHDGEGDPDAFDTVPDRDGAEGEDE